jgi:hypothetical protein
MMLRVEAIETGYGNAKVLHGVGLGLDGAKRSPCSGATAWPRSPPENSRCWPSAAR